MENRTIFSLAALNAPLGTTLSNPPLLRVRSPKTEGIYSMTTAAELKTELGLIERIEAASGPDRELDAEIAFATGWATHVLHKQEWLRPDGVVCGLPEFTASLDAAMTLVGNCLLVGLSDILAEGLPGAVLCSDTGASPPQEHHGACFNGRNATREQKLALALTAAALRARSAETAA